ncbi:HK97 family phage prohead protease [Mycolicibacterium fortuitum]|uniref:HK97 family phage prohead protease n=1 Tax=Mycolicibacterium fortuitum TaxID=1766 RepID=UPI0009451DC0|nr:HK97 family phage prohead protease [Mycolicibacterium fortuitum]
MTTPELPPWVDRLPKWVRDDEIRWLMKRPWIAGFIRPGDFNLERAEERFGQSQGRFVRQREREVVTLRGLTVTETTALRSAPVADRGVVRSVRMSTSLPRQLRGLAVPFEEKSVLVTVRGVRGYEVFDNRSFTRLPSSVALVEGHDMARPLGVVNRIVKGRDGLQIQADLNVLTHDERRTWWSRWCRGEWSSLSIGFRCRPLYDDWTTVGDMPLRIVRTAELDHVAVVREPAYRSARVIEILGPKL